MALQGERFDHVAYSLDDDRAFVLLGKEPMQIRVMVHGLVSIAHRLECQCRGQLGRCLRAHAASQKTVREHERKIELAETGRPDDQPRMPESTAAVRGFERSKRLSQPREQRARLYVYD